MCPCPCLSCANPTNSCTAFLCLILNIILPGVGTMINACCGVRCFSGIFVGILQILTIPLLLFGWIWSICYGLEIYRISGDHSAHKGYHNHH